MKTFEDIADLWKQAGPVQVPDGLDIIKKATAEKNQLANKIFVQVGFMLFSIVAICYVMYVVKFKYLTSYIGIALMFICVIVFASVRFSLARFLRQANFSQPPAVLVAAFEIFHLKQQWVNTKGALIYTTVLNFAFAFYFYETIWKAPLSNLWRLAMIAVYVAWMLVATLWIGKRNVRKENLKTQQILNDLRQLKSALGAESL